MLDSILRPTAGVQLSKMVFTSRARWMSLIIKLNASANMFYLLKHLRLLNLVNLKPMCNNLTFNEFMCLYDSYVCLLHSHFVESHPIWILEDRPLISEVALSHPVTPLAPGAILCDCPDNLPPWPPRHRLTHVLRPPHAHRPSSIRLADTCSMLSPLLWLVCLCHRPVPPPICLPWWAPLLQFGFAWECWVWLCSPYEDVGFD
jgi:hypothetical protein